MRVNATDIRKQRNTNRQCVESDRNELKLELDINMYFREGGCAELLEGMRWGGGGKLFRDRQVSSRFDQTKVVVSAENFLFEMIIQTKNRRAEVVLEEREQSPSSR